jgi:hypothetical protein
VLYVLEYKRPRERKWKPIVASATTSWRDINATYDTRRNAVAVGAYDYRVSRYTRSVQRRTEGRSCIE